VASRRTFRILTSSQQSGIKVKEHYTHSITNTHKVTIHTRQIQLTKMHIRKATQREESSVYSFQIFFPIHIAHTFLPQTFTSHHFTAHIYLSHYATFSPLPYTALHFTSPHFTSLHRTSLHFTALHFTSLHLTTLLHDSHF